MPPLFPSQRAFPTLIRSLGLGLALLFSLGASAAAPEESEALWHYGAYLDLNYAPDLTTPRSVPFRGKLTTNRLNQFSPDLGMVYLSKSTTTESPFGFELSGQAGYDTNGQLPPNQPLPGANVLRYFSRANVSYQTDIGNGLKFNGGLMNSFIGYESFYAKDNINYSRAWGSDYSPYFLIGIGASYPVNSQIDTGFYIVSDYNYLQEVNTQPKYATQFSYRINEHLKWSENAFVGPEQNNTAFQYWRGFLNSMLEWSEDDWTLAYVLDAGSQRASSNNHVQQLYVANASMVAGTSRAPGAWDFAQSSITIPTVFRPGISSSSRQSPRPWNTNTRKRVSPTGYALNIATTIRPAPRAGSTAPKAFQGLWFQASPSSFWS